MAANAPRNLRRLAVLGAGSWGTALAQHAAGREIDVNLWCFEPEVAEDILRRRENRAYLPGITLSERIHPTTDLRKAVSGAEAVLFVVPSHVARSVLLQAAPLLGKPVPFISATKGIETDTLKLPTQIMADCLDPAWTTFIGCLSGPSFAREVVQGLPTAVSLALGDPALAVIVQAGLSSAALRIYTNPDLVGLQIGGAVKNVIAIAAGISDGLGFGNSARAALITRGLAEMRRLGISLGARGDTFSGLSGLGDLVLTCTGDLSRNRNVGMKLGRGLSLDEILKQSKMVAEGVHTSEAVVKLASRQSVDMPICQQTHAIIHLGKKPQEAFLELMARGLKDEAADRPL